MKSTTTRVVLSVAALTALAAAPVRPASAQWAATAIGVAEYDTDGTFIILGGVSTGPTGMGVRPMFGLQAYYLTFDQAAGRTNVTVVRPYAGLRNRYDGGSVYGTVGYAFSSRDVPAPIVAADQGSGVVVSGGWDHWGTGERLATQVLAAYNFGTESFWGRGRGTRRIATSATGGQTRVGAEVALLSSPGFDAVQPGALMEFHDGQGRILIVGAGAKIISGGNTPIYFKVEGVLPLAR
jgi:hypothetical protein